LITAIEEIKNGNEGNVKGKWNRKVIIIPTSYDED